MAAAEARAAWQRTANRCFVQEDAKRAPKLACCSSSSSKPQSNGDVPSAPNHPASNFMPFNCNPAYSNLPPETKWWLQLQPNTIYQKDFIHDQLHASGSNLEGMRDGGQDPSCVKHEPEAGGQPLVDMDSNPKPPFNNKAVKEESWYQNEDLMDWKPIDQLLLHQSEKGFSELEAPWMAGEKIEPWWRTADRDELALLVAHKSLKHIENCDLPRPQTTNIRQGVFTGLQQCGRILSSSLDQKICTGLCNPADYSPPGPAFKSVDEKHWWSAEIVNSLNDSEKSQRFGNNNTSTTFKDPIESRYSSESNPSKAQLLEALCHSQTRAREAEKAAQQAYKEKEHVIKLFFRQASQVFAYKQWLQLLQLEIFCLQLKNNDHHISTLFPVLPWMPSSKKQMRRLGCKGTRRKVVPRNYDIDLQWMPKRQNCLKPLSFGVKFLLILESSDNFLSAESKSCRRSSISTRF